jgi:hypothetical protein
MADNTDYAAATDEHVIDSRSRGQHYSNPVHAHPELLQLIHLGLH